MAKDDFKNLGFHEPKSKEAEKPEEEVKKPGELRW